MTSRRILITGVGSAWGGRLAQVLEREAQVQAVIGVDVQEPRLELQRTEFVRVDAESALLGRIIAAAEIDTVIDTRLVDDPIAVPLRRAHETNLLGTKALLSACAVSESPVRKLIFKSSALVYGSGTSGAAFLTEVMQPDAVAGTALERDVIAAEAQVVAFAADRPEVTVTILRYAQTLGEELRSSLASLLSLPVIPSIIGFDPRCQMIHQEDAVEAMAHAARHQLPGPFNAAADGVLSLSEVVSLLGKPLLPVLPPWGTVFAAAQLRRLGLPVPLELLRNLRTGRGLDNRRLKASGFGFRYTSRETVLKLRAHQRVRPLLGSGEAPYRYEREVEDFLRWSPSVQRRGATPQDEAAGEAGDPLGDLSEEELIGIISSLGPESLRRLRHHEVTHARRKGVIEALDHGLARRSGG